MILLEGAPVRFVDHSSLHIQVLVMDMCTTLIAGLRREQREKIREAMDLTPKTKLRFRVSYTAITRIPHTSK